MTARPNALEPPGPELSQEQAELVEALVRSLNPTQALWLSGYLAGFARSGPNRAEPAAGSARRLTILYGSETGNCAELAQQAADSARSHGLHPVVTDLADYKTRLLKDEEDLLIVTSTHGEGDPPHTAEPFFEFLESRKVPALAGKRFAVIGLGDSTYEHFCQAAKRLDRRLEELGAKRLAPRLDLDVDYEKPAEEAIAGLLLKLQPSANGTPRPALHIAPAVVKPAFDKRNPYPATVLENLPLTGRDSTKETRHLELSIEGSGLHFEPGDALGVMPRNDPVLVEQVLHCASLPEEALITAGEESMTLGEALRSRLEIVRITPRLLRFWADEGGISELAALCEEGQEELRAALLRENHVVDLLRRYPLPGLDPQAFVNHLRPLQPRLYSIASSASFAPGEVHLTVAVVNYTLHGEPRHGVASKYLAEQDSPEIPVPVYVQSNPNFRLPAADVPVIMIGAGTGVAPFRAFLQERDVHSAPGRNWLFFGERNFRSDFLYQTEWQAHLKSGLLTRMDAAFSRDGDTKTYVQHRLLDRARDLYAWLQEGAHVYVCGDASAMAPGVHAALRCIVQQQAGLDSAAAEEYLTALRAERRYQVDAY